MKTEKNYVYIIQAKSMRLLKFGRTSRISTRLVELQIGSPDELTVLWTNGPIPHDQACKAEKFLHDKFAPFHVRGEWYAPEPQVIAFIEGLISVAPSGIGGVDIRLLESIAEFQEHETIIEPLPTRPIFPRNTKIRKPVRDGRAKSEDHVRGNTLSGNPIWHSDAQREKRNK